MARNSTAIPCARISAACLLFPALAAPLSAEVVINEIMYRPAATGSLENPAQEFIELHNTDPDNPVSLAGWRFTKGINYLFAPTAGIPADGYLVVAADLNAFNAKYPDAATSFGNWEGQLSNSGERIKLVDAGNNQIDEVRYSDQGDWAQRVEETSGRENGWAWASPADDASHSLELRNPGLLNGNGQNWGSSSAAQGTPGEPNSIVNANIAPLIRFVEHSPIVPDSSDEVAISAKLNNEDAALIDAVVRWRVSAGNPGAFNSSPMPGPDEDGLYTAMLPAQSEGTVVEFYAEVSDGINTRTWPAATDQGQVANAHYLVDSTPQEPGEALYRVVMTVADRNQWNSINRGSDAQMNITFIASEGGKDTVRYRSGMRVRGNGSRGFTPPPMRINIPREDPWNGDTKLNVNSRYSALQFIGMNLFGSTGLPVPDAKRVQFRINGENEARNDETMRGSYVHLEPIGDELIEDKFPDNDGGNLYKKRSANPNRDEKRWGVHSENNVRYDEPNWYLTDDWTKLTNESKGDWSDLQQFVEVMHQASGADYLEEVSPLINIGQWLRWFAVMTILNSYETNLSNGIDDDYCIYSGSADSRFILLPHDLDTIFGEGDTNSSPSSSIFPMLTANIPRQNEDGRIPQLVTFFQQPSIRKQYFTELKNLLADEFSKAKFDARVQNFLADWSTPADRSNIISYMDARRNFILNEIDPELSASSSLPVVSGLPRTTQAALNLSGDYNLTSTSAVIVAGNNATLNPIAGTWSITGIDLVPGVNRVTVEALDPDGNRVASRQIDIWHDDGDTRPLAGTISGDQTLNATAGPYMISDDVVIAAGTTLTIEPGTNVYLADGAKLTVNGVLRAIGSEFSRIRFGPDPAASLVPDPAGNGNLPNGPPKSGGIQFVDTLSSQNILSFADILHAQSEDGSVGIHRSEVMLDNMTFAGSHLRMIYADSSSLTLQNSIFPDMFAPGESPIDLDLDNISEHVKGEGAYPENGHFIIRGNTFGSNSGHNDIIDVDSGTRPDPILQILNNVFLGSGDEQLDLGGDVYVAGNLFMNVNKDSANNDRGYANSISTGDAGNNTAIVVTRNIFWDIDHAVNLKHGTSAIFENNTVVGIHPDFEDDFGNSNVGSAINLFVDEPDAAPGDGAYAANNIFWDVPRVFGNADVPGETTTPLQLYNNLLSPQLAETSVAARPGTILALGTGNLTGSPHFAGSANDNFRLLPGSPAKNMGLAGQDLGAEVPDAIAITGEPAAVTASTGAALSVGGPGMFAYRYRVNGAPWSEDSPIGNGFDPVARTIRTATIAMAGLEAGSYTVEVLGTDFAGNLQATPTVSKTWRVDPSLSRLVINEVLAANGGSYDNSGSFPDMIELHNAGATEISLTQKSITDNPALPAKFVFPENTTIPAGGYLILNADAEQTPGIHLGFSLDNDGEGIYLYESVADGGGLIDSIEYGLQIPGSSIGRIGHAGAAWALTRVTPGAANHAQPYGSPRGLRINEWLAATETLFADDFVEIHNPDSLPVPLAGLFLSQDYLPRPGQEAIAPLSFIAARGFSVFRATGDGEEGIRQLDFKLSSSYEWLYLLAEDLTQIDSVHLQAEGVDVARGRLPDGAPTYEYFIMPTPGLSNVGDNATVTTTTLIAPNAQWAYEQSNTDLGTAWRNREFDDSSWPRGPGLLYRDNDPVNGPAGTLLNLNPPTTHYFRHTFTLDGDPLVPAFNFDIFADDGAVIYLNGIELYRLRMPGGEITHATFAASGWDNAVREGSFDVPDGLMRPGENVIAASVHQDDGTSGDVVFGLELRSAVTETSEEDEGYTQALALLAGLRITEIMYHPASTEALEYIELQNIGGVPLELGGVRFTGGISFVFPEMTLDVGSYVILVADPATFEAEYGAAISVAGQYSGKLNNDGEDIVLQLPEPFAAAILRFEYNDSWYQDSDGSGYSLEILDSAAPRKAWDTAENWRASIILGGTPAKTSPPVITSPESAISTLNDSFFYQVRATNIPSSYSASGLPSWLAINTQTGVISGNSSEYGIFEVSLSATNGGGEGVTTLSINIAASGPFAGYQWSGIAATYSIGTPAEITARATDAAGRTVVNYNQNVPVGAFVGANNGSSVLITECWDRSPDYFEIENVSAGPVNTAGWFVALNQSASQAGSGINLVAPTLLNLPATMAAGEVVFRHDEDGNSQEWQAADYLGGDIPWYHGGGFGNVGRRGWVMLVDNFGNLVDFVAWGYSANELGSINVNAGGFNLRVGDAWSGGGVPWADSRNRSLTRRGNEDRNITDDWSWVARSPGNENSGLNTPFPGGFEAIPTSLNTASFVNGAWTGSVTFNNTGTDAILLLDDGAGHVTLSERFNITALPAPVITSPSTVIAVAGKPFSYQVTVTNSATTHGAANLPAGLLIDAASGLISGTPAASGNSGVTLSATNAGGSGTLALNIDVLADGDGDGMPDIWELVNGLNPVTSEDAALDNDRDTLSNLGEFLAGTDPQDPGSLFRIKPFSRSPVAGQLLLSWKSVAGKRYRVLTSGDLVNWAPLPGVNVLATGPDAEVALPDTQGGRTYFLRVTTGLDY
ncbi:MAG: lamin tail domain-containing protein [Verrucomicrobiales bacterium]